MVYSSRTAADSIEVDIGQGTTAVAVDRTSVTVVVGVSAANLGWRSEVETGECA